MANKRIDEGILEYFDENPLELRLFNYMFNLNETGFSFEAQGKVSQLFYNGNLVCRLDEASKTLYILNGIGCNFNQILPNGIREEILNYRKQFKSAGYKIQ